MLTQCGWAASRAKTSYFHAQYRKLAPRCGNKRTLIAVAHSMLGIIWHMLVRNEPFRDLGADYYTRTGTKNRERSLVRKLQQMGYKVLLERVA